MFRSMRWSEEPSCSFSRLKMWLESSRNLISRDVVVSFGEGNLSIVFQMKFVIVLTALTSSVG